MIFSPQLIGKVLDGTKTQTRRPLRWSPLAVSGDPPLDCRYRAGATYAIQPGRGEKSIGRLRVLDVTRTLPRDITTEDALAEGFDSSVEYLVWWADRYGSAALVADCWRIRFELAP